MIVETIVGISATAVIGVVGYTGKKLLTKMEGLDLILRGDGNGNPGLGEKIRDVHQEVTSIGTRLDDHVVESEGWKRKIDSNADRIQTVETKCRIVHALGD